MNNKIVLPAIGVGLLGLAALGTAKAYAQTQTGDVPSIVQEIAQKFGLNANDVQSVFNEHRQEVQNYKQTQLQQRLDQAVKDGKITSAQEQAILSKLQELRTNKQNNINNFRNMTLQQRQEAKQQQQQDLQNWAQQNNIDLNTLRSLIGFDGIGMRGGWHKGWMMNPSPSTSPAPAQ